MSHTYIERKREREGEKERGREGECGWESGSQTEAERGE